MTPMILAYRNGWLIACKVVRETPKGKFVTNSDDPLKREYYIRNAEKHRKLFVDTDKAIDWINEAKKCV